jgi:hypothetical protein
MSTLFRRLAAQNAGMPAPRIRPLASLPYPSAPAFIDPLATDASAAPAIQPGLASPTMASPAPSAGRPSFGTRPQALTQAPDTLAGVEAAPSGTRETSTQAVTTPARPANPRATLQPSTLGNRAHENATRAHSSPDAAAESHTGTSGDTGDMMPEALLPPARGQEAPQPAPRPLIPAFRHARDLPPTPSVARPAAPRPSSNPTRHGTEAAPDEIHVHIGRIEVTAVQEAPKPKARAARGQAPMSLDDYLARRQRGGT